MKRRGLAALLILAFASAARADPDPNHVFSRLLADPRQIQTSARYYRLAGRDTADLVLGNSWGMARWSEDGYDLQWDVEGMGYSRFLLSRGINEFQTIDFSVGLPFEWRTGRHSGKVSLYHESSHLGDDYIRRTGNAGFRYSVEGLEALYSFEPLRRLRVYGGGARLIHKIPSGLGATIVRAGVEVRGPEFSVSRRRCWVYLAEDLQSKSRSRWNADSNAELGVRAPFNGALKALRVYLGYFNGRSEFGQFHRQHENYYDVGASFDF